MKKSIVLSIVLSLCFLITISIPENAVAEQRLNEVVVPFYDYTSKTNTSLSISQSGVATCTASITGYQDITTKVQIYMYLEQYSNGS